MAQNVWFAELMERGFRRERVFRDRSNPLEIYNSDEVISRFRLSKEAILRLTDELSEELGPTTSRSHSIVICEFIKKQLKTASGYGQKPEFVKNIWFVIFPDGWKETTL